MSRDIDNLVYIAAFRYALGRSTYIVSAIAKALLEANLSDDDKRFIIKEINDTNGKLGMDMDEKIWLEVKATFERDLSRRIRYGL
ncbi:MAG: hypothetical protein E2O29_01830 [Deltaproteobacteria bacterium]|nr:MAG: hypothetical protein E2O29_01830 [Deltaproteobacteria bacterium]